MVTVFWHTLSPDFQKRLCPRCLVDQREFYLHVKLHLCGLETAALGVATTLGHGRRFPQAAVPQASLSITTSPSAPCRTGVETISHHGSVEKGLYGQTPAHLTAISAEADGVKYQVQRELDSSCINSY